MRRSQLPGRLATLCMDSSLSPAHLLSISFHCSSGVLSRESGVPLAILLRLGADLHEPSGSPARSRINRHKCRDVGLKAEFVNPTDTTKRTVFARLSIAVGNSLQIGGILAACFALSASRSAHSTAIAVITMVLAWVLLYFSSHAIAHWLVGRLVGIRFLFFTVGGTGNPQGWPPGLRWIFERLPFLGVQTEKLSMQKVSPAARALMWSAGVTSSAI